MAVSLFIAKEDKVDAWLDGSERNADLMYPIFTKGNIEQRERNSDLVCTHNSRSLVVDHMDTIEFRVFKLAMNGLAKAGGGGYDEYVRGHLLKVYHLV